MKENILFKYKVGGLVYYYRNQELLDEARISPSEYYAPSPSYYKLLQNAFVAINTKTNEIIKNRFQIEEIIDNFLINKGEK